MGEYAIRKSDGVEIKIGTCESMYYLRLEDKYKVDLNHPKHGQMGVFGWFWRLPFPDEDNVLPGDYENYNRSLHLWKYEDNPPLSRKNAPYSVSFSDPETVSDPGLIQLKHDSGLLVNVKCYHGEQLPQGNDDFQPHWNGKSHAFELSSLRTTETGDVWPVVKCRFCDHAWRYNWEDVLPYIHGEMKQRLEKYNLGQTIK